MTPVPSSLTMQSLLNRCLPLRARATRQRCAQLLALTLSLALAGCGGGKPAGSPVAAPPVPGSEPTLKQQLDDLERRGELPALDRSSDIAGPDADHNGIRDDIDAYITALPVNDAVKKAARQVARVQQNSMLIDLNDRVALLALSDASMASTACMSESAEAGLPLEQHNQAGKDGFAITLKIEAITANTPERAERYMAYMRALHGTTTTYPTGKVCEDE
jgi:hypothetical protein